jgi:hypothetical protein
MQSFRGYKKHFLELNNKSKFNHSSGLLTLTSKTRDKVKVHYYLVGFPKLIEQLVYKTTWTAKQLKLPIQRK